MQACSTSILNFSTGSKPGRPPFDGWLPPSAFLRTGRNSSKSTVAPSFSSGSPSAERSFNRSSTSQNPRCHGIVRPPVKSMTEGNHELDKKTSFRRCPAFGFEEPFFEPGLGCGGRPPRHQDDRLADVGGTSFRWGDSAALTPPAPPDAWSQTAWCRAERSKRSGSVCWPRQPPRHCRARGSTRRQPIGRGMLAWSPVSR